MRSFTVAVSFDAPDLNRRVRHRIHGIRALTKRGAARKVRRAGIPCGGRPFTIDEVVRS